ncbi:MAG: YtxH domain-containing protein [Bacteroides sp.]|nr:YtxH domain-containing protein [Bacteroides sp.]
MKGLNILVAFLGGAAIGAAFGLLFAPEKGEDLRQKIKNILREKGINLNCTEIEELVERIAKEAQKTED